MKTRFTDMSLIELSNGLTRRDFSSEELTTAYLEK